MRYNRSKEMTSGRNGRRTAVILVINSNKIQFLISLLVGSNIAEVLFFVFYYVRLH